MTVLTDPDIARLEAMPKTLLNPRAREKAHDRFVAREFEVEGPNGERFYLYTRQNTLDPDDYSTGLRWARKGGDVTLARYNGSSHIHRNAIEGDVIRFECHIHRLTERYQLADRKGEGYASRTLAYSNLDGALRLLYSDWNISPSTPRVSAQVGPGLI